MMSWLIGHCFCISLNDMYKVKDLLDTMGITEKWRQVLSFFVNDGFCSRCQRHVSPSTNLSLHLYPSATVTMCLCGLMGRAIRMSVIYGGLRLQTAEWRILVVSEGSCATGMYVIWWLLKTLEWILNPKTMSCFSCYVLFIIIQINNSDYILARQASYIFVSSKH